MPCNSLNLGNGQFAIVCSRGHRRKKCWQCREVGDRLCDFVVNRSNDGVPIRTCDRPLCSRHTTKGETPDIDYCSEHTESKNSREW